MGDLSHIGYTKHPRLSLWSNPKSNQEYFTYSDGTEVEKEAYRILETVSDRSIFSEELAAHCKNWFFVYHFSSLRANLLRPLRNLIENARVLELGSGCGAISRYLGETAREVLGIEGSSARAEIAALRCEDLKNTTFVVEEIQNFPNSLEKFDVVTLIGVLEYARLYSNDPQAEVKLLEKARSFLKDDGVLILAIENKFGLKYFAGVPEDHLGISWVGVVGGYEQCGVQTFSRKEMIGFLNQAGFLTQEQFIPIPDYKLPKTIIAPEGVAADQSEFDVAPFFEYSKREYMEEPLFNLQQTWSGLCKAGMLQDMADSLFFVAGVNKKNLCEKNVFCYHYGAPVKNIYAKETKIVREEDGVYVRRQPIFQRSTQKGIYKQVIEDEPYYIGEILIAKARSVCMYPGWDVEDFIEVLAPWVNWLKTNVDKETGLLPKNFIDAIPINMILDKDNNLIFFDKEWVGEESVPFLYVITRGLWILIDHLGIVSSSKSGEHIQGFSILESLLKKYNIMYTNSELEKIWQDQNLFEKAIQNFETINHWDGLCQHELRIRPAVAPAVLRDWEKMRKKDLYEKAILEESCLYQVAQKKMLELRYYGSLYIIKGWITNVIKFITRS